MVTSTRPTVLTIAGSDSGGGAGVQADLKTFAAFDCFGTSVITAVTAQNTLGVSAVHPIPVEVVTAQIEALRTDLPPTALKTGMLATAEVVAAVAAGVERLSPRACIVDPVMVSTSGDRLLTEDAVAMVREKLLPLATCVTPNIHEAELLTGITVRDRIGMVAAGNALLALGAEAALIKGGHLEGDTVLDVLVTTTGVIEYPHDRVVTTSTHGTGCTLSAAIAAAIALGEDLPTAIASAIGYLERALRAAPGIGSGNGPLWHGVPTS